MQKEIKKDSTCLFLFERMKGESCNAVHKGRHHSQSQRGGCGVHSPAVHRYFRPAEECGHHRFAD